MSTAFRTSSVESIVKRGWRRRFLVLAVDQSALVLALVFGGCGLLILLGTQILAWEWLFAILAVGLVLATLGVRKQLADEYRVAQLLDHRLSLHDSLSTAWFLKTKPVEAPASAVAYQLSRAEELARAADPVAAFPFQRRRIWLITASLFLLAFGLFSARYLVTRELSLTRPFLPLGLTQVIEYVRNAASKGDKQDQSAAARQSGLLPPNALGQDGERQSKQATNPPAQQPDQQSAAGDANANNQHAQGQNPEQAKNQNGRSGDQKSGQSNGSPKGANSASNKDGSNGDKQDSSPDSNGAQRSNSLMDRMRDALSSVMAKIKPSNTPQNSQSGSQKSADGKSSDQAGNKDPSGQSDKDSGKEQSAQEQASGEQKGQGTAKAQASQGQESSQSSDKKSSDAQSGVGHSDGSKDVKAAEDAKAMGKLAEIIGKRSANITGDMQIEPSGKQRLQTDYTHQQGHHADLGGEMNRDEIPVEDQEYVREYMELVRKKPVHAAKPQ